MTEWVLKEVFEELFYRRVELEGMILKPNMIVPGKKCAMQTGVEEVAERTVKILKRCVPRRCRASRFFPAASPTRKPPPICRR